MLPLTLSLEDGTRAVALARSAIEARTKGAELPVASSSGAFDEERGVFVTVNKVQEGEDRLRGCIGFPYPVMALGTAIANAAAAACSEDPRFPPVSVPELDKIVVEVSVLTEPTTLGKGTRSELPNRVRVGTDGLIIRSKHGSGLLLPQVATEFGFSQEEFLGQACIKAGLPPDSWLDPDTEVLAFQADIFGELAPRGRVGRLNAETER